MKVKRGDAQKPQRIINKPRNPRQASFEPETQMVDDTEFQNWNRNPMFPNTQTNTLMENVKRATVRQSSTTPPKNDQFQAFLNTSRNAMKYPYLFTFVDPKDQSLTPVLKENPVLQIPKEKEKIAQPESLETLGKSMNSVRVRLHVDFSLWGSDGRETSVSLNTHPKTTKAKDIKHGSKDKPLHLKSRS